MTPENLEQMVNNFTMNELKLQNSKDEIAKKFVKLTNNTATYQDAYQLAEGIDKAREESNNRKLFILNELDKGKSKNEIVNRLIEGGIIELDAYNFVYGMDKLMTQYSTESIKLDIQKPPREIINIHFNHFLPIKGGWGYTKEDAVIINKNDVSIVENEIFNGVKYEYEFVEKRIYEELIVKRHPKKQFAGIKWDLIKQSSMHDDEGLFDYLEFDVTAWLLSDWDELKEEWEKNYDNSHFDEAAHISKRESKKHTFKSEFWFEISSFYGQNDGIVIENPETGKEEIIDIELKKEDVSEIIKKSKIEELQKEVFKRLHNNTTDSSELIDITMNDFLNFIKKEKKKISQSKNFSKFKDSDEKIFNEYEISIIALNRVLPNGLKLVNDLPSYTFQVCVEVDKIEKYALFKESFGLASSISAQVAYNYHYVINDNYILRQINNDLLEDIQNLDENKKEFLNEQVSPDKKIIEEQKIQHLKTVHTNIGRRIFKVLSIIIYLITFILLVLAILSDGNILLERKHTGIFTFETVLNTKNFLTLILSVPSLLITQYIIYGSINPFYIFKYKKIMP